MHYPCFKQWIITFWWSSQNIWLVVRKKWIHCLTVKVFPLFISIPFCRQYRGQCFKCRDQCAVGHTTTEQSSKSPGTAYFLLMTHHSLILTSFQTHLILFLLSNTKQEIQPNESRWRRTVSSSKRMKQHRKLSPYDLCTIFQFLFNISCY